MAGVVRPPSEGGHSERPGRVFNKTRLCTFFTKGQCVRGTACSFAHGASELQARPDLYKTELCFNFTKRGGCKEGAGPGLATLALPKEAVKEEGCGGGMVDTSAVCRQLQTLLQQATLLQQELHAFEMLRAAAPIAGPAALRTGEPQHDRPPAACEGGRAAEECLKADRRRADHPDSSQDFNGLSFSRQSTAEATGLAAGWSRQATIESTDDWDDSELKHSPAEGGLEGGAVAAVPKICEEGRKVAEAEGCVLRIRNTFIHAEDAHPLAASVPPQRAASMPAAARCDGRRGR